jgi:peptidoglycan hydrolase-like protein with peptidoglycan-binding domain
MRGTLMSGLGVLCVRAAALSIRQTVELHPDVPGRGAWTRTGGLLPLKPGGSGPGYYRAPIGDESMIGTDPSYSGVVVREGVRVIQRLARVTADGLLGDKTAVGIIKAQRRFGLSEDGIAGPKTLRALLEPLIAAKATQYALPLDVLGGVCVFESGLDLAAVGVSGWDTGICQINLAASAARGMTVADAVDPSGALDFTAKAMRVVHDRWAGKTEADVYDVVVASHNSPKSAQILAETGTFPYSQDRADHGFIQIEDYVRKVRSAW